MFNKRFEIISIGFILIILSFTLLSFGNGAEPEEEQEQPEYPPLADVIEDYEQVISTADGERSYYTVWIREKDGQMLAALPSGYEGKKFFIALTIASGEDFAGLQAGDMYVYWRRYDKRLALVEPNIRIKSTGDDESKSSVERLFTDRIILDVPIVTMSGGSPVIDMDALLIGQASKFFGSSVTISNSRLIKIQKAKAFPQNIEIAFEIPTANGQLQTLHYSISEIPSRTGYKTREADERVGYFTTSFNDYGKFEEPDTIVRYINRWHLEKADSSLKTSPPKNPIVFYIEHTTPVRYRRWVREGILYWNEAFENVGISNAIEVYYQDKESGAHMEKDPEDVRYNFIRWLNNNQGTAIGPSRVHPETGQILDADIILTDGWIRHFWTTFTEIMPDIAMEGINPETLAWLNNHPNWDPRIRLAPPSERNSISQEIASHSNLAYGGHPITRVDPTLIGDDEYDGLIGRTSQINGLCNLSAGKAFDVALFRMYMTLMEGQIGNNGENGNENGEDDDDDGQDDEKNEDEEPMIDGMPETFIGPMLAELVCHEVGHTLGLRHNFKGSSAYSLEEINSEQFKGKKPNSASVMDYLPVNMNLAEPNEFQGDYTMIGVGPYDIWAIEYGYTQNEKDLEEILSRVAEPELQYGTDEDTYGPDPLSRSYDFSSNPIEHAQTQIDIAQHNRDRIIDSLVKDGESWAKTRRLYEMTLSLQLRAINTMSNWLGGAFIYRDKKGDPNARLPIEVVPAEKQREALSFVINNTFKDEAFGLTEDLLKRMTVDKWLDDITSALDDSTWPIHDRIMGIQATILASLMYPTTLRRIYDNEFLLPPSQDALTLPELLENLTEAIWTELEIPTDVSVPNQTDQLIITFTAREPMISSLRRNLQREHLELMIDLTGTDYLSTTAYRPIANLIIEKLRQIEEDINTVLESNLIELDPYTRAHLTDAQQQIDKAIEAQYIYKVLN